MVSGLFSCPYKIIYVPHFMGKSHKKSRSDRVNALRKRYDAFLEEDRKRKARNEYILDRLDKMRYTVSELQPRFKNSIMNSVSPITRTESIKTKENFQLMPQVNQLSLPINCITPSNVFDDRLLLKEIEKKFILIPKSRAISCNIQENPETDNDWKSKYNILDHLKSIEKQDISQNESGNFGSNYELSSENNNTKKCSNKIMENPVKNKFEKSRANSDLNLDACVNESSHIEKPRYTDTTVNDDDRQDNILKSSEHFKNDPKSLTSVNNPNKSLHENFDNCNTKKNYEIENTSEYKTNEIIDDDKDVNEKEMYFKNENKDFAKEANFHVNNNESMSNSKNNIYNYTDMTKGIDDLKRELTSTDDQSLQKKYQRGDVNESVKKHNIDKNPLKDGKDYYEHNKLINNEILESQQTDQHKSDPANEQYQTEKRQNDDKVQPDENLTNNDDNCVSEKDQRNDTKIRKEENVEIYDQTTPQSKIDDTNTKHFETLAEEDYVQNTTKQHDQVVSDHYYQSPIQEYEQEPIGKYDEVDSKLPYQHELAPNNQYEQVTTEQYNQIGSEQYEYAAPEQYDTTEADQYNQISTEQYDQMTEENYDQNTTEQYEQTTAENYDQKVLEHYDQTAPEQYDQTNLEQYNQITSEQCNEMASEHYEQRASNHDEQTDLMNHDQIAPEQYGQMASEQYDQPIPEHYNQLAPEQYEVTNPEQYEQQSSEQYEQQSSEQYGQIATNAYDEPPTESYPEENFTQYNVRNDNQIYAQQQGDPFTDTSNNHNKYEQNYQENEQNENNPVVNVNNGNNNA